MRGLNGSWDTQCLVFEVSVNAGRGTALRPRDRIDEIRNLHVVIKILDL